MSYAAALSARAQRPQAAQCCASIRPAMCFASAVGLFSAETPSGIASASRIGPTSFFPHHSALCRARVLVKNALHINCIVMTGTEHPPRNIGLSIAIPNSSPGNNNARYVKSRHQRRQTTVKNPSQVASNFRRAA